MPTSHPDPDGGPAAREAPSLARPVRAGKLPRVSQRLPRDPLVVHPFEAPGWYGGVWHMMVDDPDLGMYKMIGGYAPLLRWKADCSGLVPGTARSWSFNEVGSRLTIHLRHGIRWSDGVEFTADDVAYWAQLCKAGDTNVSTPYWARVDGKGFSVEAPDKYTIVMKFAGPNWYVPLHLATGYWESETYCIPKHYMQRFDPHFNHSFADYSVFAKKNLAHFNPDRPTLWPWKLTAIEDGGFRMVFDRNPNYFAVDTLGRQLPYIDRIICTYVPSEQIRVLKILSSEIDAQFRLVDPLDIGLYMRGRKHGDYRIIRWATAGGADSGFMLNWSCPDLPTRALIRDVRFRKALSLAVDRDKCNEVAWRGMAHPQQATISRQAWHFQTPVGRRVFDAWARSYAQFDLVRANRYLDEMGLTRDAAGYRMRPDGNRVSLLIDLPPQNVSSPDTDEAVIVAEGWRNLGIEVVLHNWPAAEVDVRHHTGKYTVSIFGESEMDLFTYPDWVFPTSDMYWHVQVGKWYRTGGNHGEPRTEPLTTLIHIYQRIEKEKDIRKAHELVLDAVRLEAREGLFTIGTAADPPFLVIAKNSFRNIPTVPRVIGPWAVAGPATSYPESFFFARPGRRAPSHTGAALTSSRQMAGPAPPGPAGPSAGRSGSQGGRDAERARMAGFIVRRVLLAIPMIWAISVIAFTIIQMPPGDFLDQKIARLEQQYGDASSIAQADALRHRYGLDRPLWERYVKWASGFVRGDFGESFRYEKDVKDLIWERLGLTLILSVGSMLFTYLLAIPLGIYSATHEYHWTDNFLTFCAFFGMSLPGFLVTLAIIVVAYNVFGVPLFGLFSPYYQTANWSLARFADLLRHLWIPVIVISLNGTAGLVRVMRGNLLDVLGEPFVRTARAKGLSEPVVVIKHAARIAINPLISMMG